MLETGCEVGGSFNLLASECGQIALGLSPPCLPPALTFSLWFAPSQPSSFLSAAPENSRWRPGQDCVVWWAGLGGKEREEAASDAKLGSIPFRSCVLLNTLPLRLLAGPARQSHS